MASDIIFLRQSFLCVLIFFCFGIVFSQESNKSVLLQSELSEDFFIKELNKKININSEFNPKEKVYLHTDKTLFRPGEDLWYSGYTVLGSDHQYSLASKLLHIELIDFNGVGIVSQVKAIDLGKSFGVIELPKDLPPGEYQLRAYTDWMRNYEESFFFHRRIQIVGDGIEKGKNILIKSDKIDLQFFPEGGDAVSGINTLIAYKAIGEDGFGINVRGKILNSKGEIVRIISSIDRGSGFFNLKPEEGQRYTAILDNGLKYDLPEIKKIGYVLNIISSDDERLMVKVDANATLKNESFYVIGQIREQKYFQGKFEFKDNLPLVFEIPKDILTEGVMTLTLFDKDGIPRNERVVFIDNKEELRITTRLNRNSFKARDKVVLDVNVKDNLGNPVVTNLSLAITDRDKVEKHIHSSNIMTSLLLESELKGHIETPGLYLERQERSPMAKSRLDLLMMTNGWRRIKWDDLDSEIDKQSKAHFFSQGLRISGIAKESRKKPLVNGSFTMLSRGKDNSERIYYAETNGEGRFSIEGINQSDSLDLEFVAFNKGGKPIDVLVELDDRVSSKFSSVKFSNNWAKYKKTKENTEAIYIEASKLKEQTDSIFGYLDATVLGDVLLEGKTREEEEEETAFLRSRPSEFGITPDDVVYLDENRLGTDLSVILTQLAGVRAITVIDPANFLPTIRISSRNGAPLIILDGIPIDIDALVQLGLIGSSVSTTIERIEFLSGARAALYGRRGAEGVILLYSRRGNGGITRANTALTSKHRIKGYSISKEFYSPKYDVKQPEHIKPDYRTTLYWNPNVKTDKNGNAKVIFYNSDITESIQVDIQGLSDNGIPGVYLETFGENEDDK